MSVNKQADLSNKLLVESVKILVPNYTKQLFMTATINDSESFQTPSYSFNKGIISINQIFQFTADDINTITFGLREKSGIFSNVILKGVFKFKELDSVESLKSLSCFLNNNSNESIALVTFTLMISSQSHIFEYYHARLQTSHSLSKSEQKTPGFISKLIDVASLSNAENFQKFIKNMVYPTSVLDFLEGILKWKSYKDTLLFLLLLNFFVMFPKLFMICLPLIAVFIHFCFKKSINSLSLKEKKFESIDGINFISNSIDYVNSAISSYESFIEILCKSDGAIGEEIYFEVSKFSLWIGLFFLIKDIDFLLSRNLFLLAVWVIVLMFNSDFLVFFSFMKKLFYVRFIKPSQAVAYRLVPSVMNLLLEIIDRLVFLCVFCIPFYSQIEKMTKQKADLSVGSGTKSLFFGDPKSKDEANQPSFYKALVESALIKSSSEVLSDTVKFEIYENERWWMIVGWAKNLVLNEAPLWSDLSMSRYIDKNTILISSDYEWEGDWKIDLSGQADNQGWQYSNDFKSEFSKESFGKYARRRKWVRVAKKKLTK